MLLSCCDDIVSQMFESICSNTDSYILYIMIDYDDDVSFNLKGLTYFE